jgi:hypothetical protein
VAGLAPAIARPTFRPYFSADVIGADRRRGEERAGDCLRRGRRAGPGAERARALISRGFAEMQRFGLAMGAQAETLSGLSGLGDLVLTCSSSSSRNFSLGKALGEGQTASAALAGRATVAEGAYTAPVLADLARQKEIAMPLVEAVVTLVQGQAPARDVVASLLAAPARNVRLADSLLPRRLPRRRPNRPISPRWPRAGAPISSVSCCAWPPACRSCSSPGASMARPRRPLCLGDAGGRTGRATGHAGAEARPAQQLAKEDRPGASVVADALLLSALVSVLCAVLLWLVPIAMFPAGITPPPNGCRWPSCRARAGRCGAGRAGLSL